MEIDKIEQEDASRGIPLLGQFRPKCDKNGDYNIVQSHEGYSWCVNQETGEEVDKTRIRFAQPNCDMHSSKYDQ